MKNQIYIKNSSKDVNFGLHDLFVVIRTDGGRIEVDKRYIAEFKIDYGTKKDYKTDLILLIREEDNMR